MAPKMPEILRRWNSLAMCWSFRPGPGWAVRATHLGPDDRHPPTAAQVHPRHDPVIRVATQAEPLVRGLVPGPAVADRDLQRHGQVVGRPHAVAHELLELLALALGDLEHQFVVHLQ